ncbi:MAG TPA: biotin--[acetyl-CoA-carboxylase] ligase, partial [Hyphomicrobiales bacterium]|nr:biotin--[acetyl-CoA-carboxylase] ligase [Hyphomicrobiales bacterium]
ADYPVTNLKAEGAAVSPEALLDALMAAFTAAYGQWALGEGFAAIRERWLDRAAGLGEAITVRLPGREIRGIFEALGPDGALALRDAEGALKHIAAGEVFFPSTDALAESSPQGHG